MNWDGVRRGRGSGGWGPHGNGLGEPKYEWSGHGESIHDASRLDYQMLEAAGFEGPSNLDKDTAQFILKAFRVLEVRFRDIDTAREEWNRTRLESLRALLARNLQDASKVSQQARDETQAWIVDDAVQSLYRRLLSRLNAPLPGGWTEQRDAELVRLHDERQTCAFIAERLCCSQDDVRRRLRFLGELL